MNNQSQIENLQAQIDTLTQATVEMTFRFSIIDECLKMVGVTTERFKEAGETIEARMKLAQSQMQVAKMKAQGEKVQ